MSLKPGGVAVVVLAAVSLAGEGCQTDDVPVAQSAISHLVSIEIIPPTAALVIEASTPAELDFKAMGTYPNKEVGDVSGQVQWGLSDPGLGGFDGAVRNRFRSSITRGGRTTITAKATPHTATAALTLTYAAALVHGAAPANAPSLFKTAAEDPAKAPTITSPADGSILAKVPATELKWTPAPGTDLFELMFGNDITDLRLYTTESSLKPSDTEWSILAGTNAGGTVTVKVRGMAAASPSAAGTSAQISVSIER